MVKSLVFSLIILFLSQPFAAQTESTDPKVRMKSWEQHLRMEEKSPFKNLKWRAVGPRF